jgi:rRNA maturation protein Nop10
MKQIRIDHQTRVAVAKARPGIWTPIAVYPNVLSGTDAAKRIVKAERMPSYAPRGSFEAYSAPHEDGGTAVWARYVTGVTNLEPRPLEMTYRVCDRGTGPGYTGVRVVTITVKAECPRCGGPRGAATPYRFAEDGAWYTVDRWTNECGHEDMYDAVLVEHRKRVNEAAEAQERAVARALFAGRNAAALPALLRDARPLRTVAAPRVARSESPRRFKTGMARTLAAVEQGEDLATAVWTAVDPVHTAAEIEALAGVRRLAITHARKETK